MMIKNRRLKTLILAQTFLLTSYTVAETYSWSFSKDSQPLLSRVPAPKGYRRIPVPDGSFAAWLRGLPMKVGHPPVHLYDGQLKNNQDVHVAVVDIDVGSEDLQQCADAIMRLRAEYLYASGKEESICFRFTSGDKAEWLKWKEGYRPLIVGNYVKWIQRKKPDSSYQNFRAYLTEVDRWAGTASISKELIAVADPKRVELGDVFIKGGFPGHAVVVVDIVENKAGRRLFLMAQSYMPAQEIHILKNPNSKDSPWYEADDPNDLVTPEWTFSRNALKRFSSDGCPTFH